MPFPIDEHKAFAAVFNALDIMLRSQRLSRVRLPAGEDSVIGDG